ncbi:hypothetical protein Raf01_25040 [Rugosimonospora africana]|uniref:Uncharacterized protein n=1 Tax=Rugosimonospora africana TaxID=556532 RepID=A0A8J3QRB3_9ACTN|nr:hypothetical protein Raf01_25040 [Rugosimonospora africana]
MHRLAPLGPRPSRPEVSPTESRYVLARHRFVSARLALREENHDGQPHPPRPHPPWARPPGGTRLARRCCRRRAVGVQPLGIGIGVDDGDDVDIGVGIDGRRAGFCSRRSAAALVTKPEQ